MTVEGLVKVSIQRRAFLTVEKVKSSMRGRIADSSVYSARTTKAAITTEFDFQHHYQITSLHTNRRVVLPRGQAKSVLATPLSTDAERSVHSPTSERRVHLLAARVLLGTLALFTWYRRQILLGLSLLLVAGGALLAVEWQLSAWGIAGMVLVAASEWLVLQAAGGRVRWPVVAVLLMCSGGVAIISWHLSVLTGSGPLAALAALALILFGPWTSLASTWIVAGIDSGQHEDAQDIMLTRALLGKVAEAALRQVLLQLTSGPSLGRCAELESRIASLLLLVELTPALESGQRAELRGEALGVYALLQDQSLEPALEAMAPLANRAELLKRRPADSLEGSSAETPTSRAAELAIRLIHAYRNTVEVSSRRHCRFEPSCSVYAETAFRRFGFWGGALIAIKRALKCVPNGGAGFDPVPPTTRREGDEIRVQDRLH